MKPLSNWSWLIVVLLAFGLVFLQSIEFEYVDGDDATSIAYHVLGRNETVQSVYAPYQRMMDRVLAILPPVEPLLRHASIALTAIFTLLMVGLAIHYGFQHLDAEQPPAKWIITLVILLAIPELFYFGLVYSPTMVGFSFIVLSHLLLRILLWNNESHATWKAKQWMLWLLSVLLFGLGVSFRWNLAAYVLVIFVEFFNNRGKALFSAQRFYWIAAWGLAATVASASMIALSGYNFSGLVTQLVLASDVVSRAGTLASNANVSTLEALLRTTLTLSPMITPGFGLLALVGFYRSAQIRDFLAISTLAGLAGSLPWLKTGNPKFLIVALPGLVACFCTGFVCLWQVRATTLRRSLYRAAIILLCIFPWVIGVQMARAESAWGPSFELKPYDYDKSDAAPFKVAFGAGAAFPTFEGPRPLYGHAYVLLGGKWRDFIRLRVEERANAIDAVISNHAFLIVTDWSPDFYLDKLYEMGFHTTDPQNQMAEGGYFTKRQFRDSEGRNFVMLFHEIDLSEVSGFLDETYKLSGIVQYVVVTGYPSMMRELYLQKPELMEPIGVNIAILKLSG